VGGLLAGLTTARIGSVSATPGSSGWLVATAAGDGSAGNGVAAPSASFNSPDQVTVDVSGNVLIADTADNTVRVIATTSGTFYGTSMAAGEIYTLVGTGLSGYVKANGIPATHGGLYDPQGVDVDSDGNVLISDSEDDLVRMVATTSGTFYGRAMVAGDIYAIAGDGTGGYSGDGGKAISAELSSPAQLAVDGEGNVLIPDSGNARVRVLALTTGTFYGTAMTAGDIYTVAGNGTAGYSGNGAKATSAELDDPLSAVVDASGNLVISDAGNVRVRVVAETTGTFYGRAMNAGDIYAVAGNGKAGYSGDGGKATSAGLDDPTGGTSVDPSGNLVINDSNNYRVRVVAESTGRFYNRTMTAGDIYTIAGDGALGSSGDGGPAKSAELGRTDSTSFDGNRNLIVDDGDNVRVVAVTSGAFYGQAMTAGDIYTIAGNDTEGFSGDGGAAPSAELDAPEGITSDAHGDIFVADDGNLRVRMIPASTSTFFGQAMMAGDIYTIAGDGSEGSSGDGGPATSAELEDVAGVALDGSGNLVVTDEGAWQVKVVAASTGTFYGQAMTAGDIYLIAGNGLLGYSGIGGPATTAEIGCPLGTVVDPRGNVVFSDSCNERIMVVADANGTFYGQAMTAGDLYSIAGDGTGGYSGDGGPATSAELNEPALMTMDAAGNLVFADGRNNRIRVVAVTTGTYYGQAMTAGDIYSVAGTGAAGYTGNGRLATKAELDHPDDVVIDEAGNLVLTDAHNNVVRVVANRTGSYYGQAMKKGDIYLLAGTGSYGWAGDGGPPASAELANPDGITAVAQADRGTGSAIYVGDLANSRLRLVS